MHQAQAVYISKPLTCCSRHGGFHHSYPQVYCLSINKKRFFHFIWFFVFCNLLSMCSIFVDEKMKKRKRPLPCNKKKDKKTVLEKPE